MTNTANKAPVETPAAAPQDTALRFEADRGAARSTWIALALVIAIVGWMGSGFVLPSDDETATFTREDPAPLAVAVTTSLAEEVTQFYRAEGQALADRDTGLVAETSGDIAEVLVRRGQDVAAGDVIARFDPAANQAEVNRAAQDLATAQREFDNASALLDRGVATNDRVTQARAALAAAQAQVIEVQQDTNALEITAPFGGRIETLDLDVGEYVSAGTQVARLVDITPLTVEIQVPQQSLTLLEVGQPASVEFITGEKREGIVTFVGSAAAAETRTFLAEIEVDNADGAIPSGISAQVVIPTGTVTAHFLPPSIVSLNTQGDLGIKTVDSDATVAFFPIEVVDAQIDGVWVTGLPDSVDVITVGQGFVSEGEVAAPRPAEMN